ncbi:hypothetical protein [Tenacibaculum caenipelagi]|uniref:hypothetical protein n=1 Tax=Tenacibaculum caenipelagi TaxID=1325435 RepID=UPI001414F435|nr:hypothetical protein [Tenacibaculum caenipelagi]
MNQSNLYYLKISPTGRNDDNQEKIASSYPPRNDENQQTTTSLRTKRSEVT